MNFINEEAPYEWERQGSLSTFGEQVSELGTQSLPLCCVKRTGSWSIILSYK